MKYIFSCIICYIAITACNGDITVLTDTSQNEIPLSLSPRIVSEVIQSRNMLMQYEGPVMDSALPGNSEIGVTLYRDTTSFEEYHSVSGNAANLRWINIGNEIYQKWQMLTSDGNETSFLLNNTDGYAVAYYPYQTNLAQITDSEGNEISALYIEPGTTDYLYGKSKQSVNNKKPIIEIPMKHMMSMISFVFTHDPAYRGACDIQEITLKNIRKSALASIRHGNFSGESLSGEFLSADKKLSRYHPVTNLYKPITASEPVNFLNKSHYGISSIPENGTVLFEPSYFHLFVIPQNGQSTIASDGIYLELLIDDIRYKIPFPNDHILENGRLGFKWEKAINTLYHITLSKNNVRLTYLLDGFEQGGDPDFEFGRTLRPNTDLL